MSLARNPGCGLCFASPSCTTSEALIGAAFALEGCATYHGLSVSQPVEFARAAVIAYLNLTDRDDEAARVSLACASVYGEGA